MEKLKENLIQFIEEILFLISFTIFVVAMFTISILVGLISLSIVIFIIAIAITYIKMKGGIENAK